MKNFIFLILFAQEHIRTYSRNNLEYGDYGVFNLTPDIVSTGIGLLDKITRIEPS